MSGVTITLQRVDIKGRIAFMPPKEPELQEAIRKVLRSCRDKNNDYVYKKSNERGCYLCWP